MTPPYYYGNSQDELLHMYREVRDAIDAPLYIYNIPSTVKTRVEIPTIIELAREGTVAGIKDSQGDLRGLGNSRPPLRRPEFHCASSSGRRP